LEQHHQTALVSADDQRGRETQKDRGTDNIHTIYRQTERGGNTPYYKLNLTRSK